MGKYGIDSFSSPTMKNCIKSTEINGNLLSRNTMINLVGLGLPLIVAVITMPFVIRGLGTERFGILAFAWAIIGYFSMFDLGLGRASTKYVAEALGGGRQESVPSIVKTAVTTQAVLGFLGGLFLAVITPLLVERFLNIRQDLVAEARLSFYLLSLSIPAVLVSGSFRGVLEAAQRFDLVNAVRAPFSAANFLLPLIGVFLGYGLPGIVALLVTFRWLALAILCFLYIRLFSPWKVPSRFRLADLRILVSFGVWVTVSSIIGPVLVYLDRFIIGILQTMTAVAHYSAPYEMVVRLIIIPSSIVATLFPAFSALIGANEQSKNKEILVRSSKYLFLVTAPIVALMIFFAEDILTVWLGKEFAQRSTLVFQILSIGVLFNSLAYLPHSLIQAMGRPDVPAKFHLIELVLYVGLAWFLIGKFAVVGAALAWTLRVALDGFLLWAAAWKFIRVPDYVFVTNGMLGGAISLVGLAGAFLMISFSDNSLTMQAILASVALILFALTVWYFALDAEERRTFKLALSELLNARAIR
jgi:O-antigen/teichoic acid export membrane protein